MRGPARGRDALPRGLPPQTTMDWQAPRNHSFCAGPHSTPGPSAEERPPLNHLVNTPWHWQPRTEQPPLCPDPARPALLPGPWWVQRTQREDRPPPAHVIGPLSKRGAVVTGQGQGQVAGTHPGEARKGVKWRGERTRHESRIQGSDTCPLCHQTWLKKHKSKE